ncbi:unnamed protein product [Symbiodinium sp. CCMP2592]|nr:unnamed protein product [Symbiodinium sp. CCMP2592]
MSLTPLSSAEVLSFVHGDAGILLYGGAKLVVRHAAFYTPFRGWQNLDGVPTSERPPSITGIRFESGGATVVMDNVICEGLTYCLRVESNAAVTITNSLFMDNYQAIRAVRHTVTVQNSVFFRNHEGAFMDYGKIEDSLFLLNSIGGYSQRVQFRNCMFAQNSKGMRGRWPDFENVLFFENDIGYMSNDDGQSVYSNVTFLDNRISMQLLDVADIRWTNFLGTVEYHLHYTASALYNLDAGSIFWNTTSTDVVSSKIYDALDGSGKGLVRLLTAESLPMRPFLHGMYSDGVCAGQCGQKWFNANWSSLIGAGAGTFGYFDTARDLRNGQALQEALLNGYRPDSNMDLSMYVLDIADMLGAVWAYQTVGTTTSPLPGTSSTARTTTTTTTTTVAAHLLVGANTIMTEPVWLFHDTVWAASDGIRALAKQVTILPDVTLTIEGDENSTAVVLSFVHGDAGILLYGGAKLVVRHAAFYTPFRGWQNLDGVPTSERPPSITGIRFESGGATVVMDNVICEGLTYCLRVESNAAVTITNSLFMDNYQAIRAVRHTVTVQNSVFFRNHEGAFMDYGKIEDSLFLLNSIGGYSQRVQFRNCMFAQNSKGMRGRWPDFENVLFFENDIGYMSNDDGQSVYSNVTFLDNRISMQLLDVADIRWTNFLGAVEYHLHYTASALYNLDAGSIFWNTTSTDVVSSKIYDALDGSGKGLVRLLAAESIPMRPFLHGMYSDGICAGQCGQKWFNANWSSLIGAGAGTFGYFDTARDLRNGQALQEALLNGYRPDSNMDLSMYVLDIADMLGAVWAYQTLGISTTTTSRISTTTASTTVTSTSGTATSRLLESGVNVTEPVFLQADVNWTAGLHTLGSTVAVMPGATLTIQGDPDFPAAPGSVLK